MAPHTDTPDARNAERPLGSSRDGEAPGASAAPNASGADQPHEALPYHIELWDAARRSVERALGDALSAPLAQAIFQSALREYPGRYITLRYGTRIIARSDGEPRRPE